MGALVLKWGPAGAFKRILQGPKHSAKLFVFAILYCYWNITTMIECIKVFFSL